MKKMFGFAFVGALLAGMSLAQTATTSGSDTKTETQKDTQPPKSDLKDAGSDVKEAGKGVARGAKAVGRATAKGTKKGYTKTKHAVHKGAKKTSKATRDTKSDMTTQPTDNNPPAETTQPK